MGALTEVAMRGFLSKSISSLNQNKLNGLLAEVDFRNYLISLGFGDRISVGGWIARTDGAGSFANSTVVFFPEIIRFGSDYAQGRERSRIPDGLHAICATFNRIGINSYFLSPDIPTIDDFSSMVWKAKQ